MVDFTHHAGVERVGRDGQDGGHEAHDFLMYIAEAGGCCDCGDLTNWKESGCCPAHKPSGPTPTTTVPLPLHRALEIIVYNAFFQLLPCARPPHVLLKQPSRGKERGWRSAGRREVQKVWQEEDSGSLCYEEGLDPRACRKLKALALLELMWQGRA